MIRVEIVLVEVERGRFEYAVTTWGERGGFGSAVGALDARGAWNALALVHRVFRVPEGPWEAGTIGLRFRWIDFVEEEG